MTLSKDQPTLLEGGLAVDDRGRLTFVNSFDFECIKRFYLIENHRTGFIRAWHGHKREAKYFFVVSGAAIIGAVKVTDWETPARNSPVARYVLAAEKPAILYVPPGFANGLMSLREDTRIMVLSTSTLQESQGDDFRYDARLWDCWSIAER